MFVDSITIINITTTIIILIIILIIIRHIPFGRILGVLVRIKRSNIPASKYEE